MLSFSLELTLDYSEILQKCNTVEAGLAEQIHLVLQVLKDQSTSS